MRKTVAMLAAMTFLSGCGEGSLENQIREHMNDPSAAQFKDKITHGKYACISVNGKNGFGGYVGFKRLKMRNIGGDGEDYWLTETEGQPCTKEMLVHDSEMDEADEQSRKVAEAGVITAMKQAKLIPATVKEPSEISDPTCKKAAEKAFTVAGMSVMQRYVDNRAGWKAEADRRLAAFTQGTCKPPEGLNND